MKMDRHPIVAQRVPDRETTHVDAAEWLRSADAERDARYRASDRKIFELFRKAENVLTPIALLLGAVLLVSMLLQAVPKFVAHVSAAPIAQGVR